MEDEEKKRPTQVTREELYRQVWKTPMSRLAAEYGISGNGLAKICSRLNIPYSCKMWCADVIRLRPEERLFPAD